MRRLMKGQAPDFPTVYSQAPPPTPRVEPDEAAELRRLIGVLIKGRWLILAVIVAVVVPVAIWTAMQPRLYRSSALIEIDPDPVQVLPYREIERPSLTANFEMFMKGQDQLLRSPVLVQRISERLQEDPEKLLPEAAVLGSALSVQRLENTYMFRVGYVAQDPAVAARIANIYAEEYIKSHFETRQRTREKAKELLEREIETLESRVQQSEKGLVSYAQQNKLPATATSAESPARAKLGQLLAENTQTEAEVMTLRSKLEMLEKSTPAEFPPSLIDNTLAGLQNKALQLEGELASLRGTFGENWPSVVAKRQEAELLAAQIDREKDRALAQAREQARLDFTVADNKRALVAKAVAEQQTLVNQVENATIEYNIIRREVDTNQKMYEGMLERLKMASVTTGMEFGGLQVVEPATPSGSVDSPKVFWNLLIASVLGLGLGICFVVARDYWDTTVQTMEEVEQYTGLPMLGSVPKLRASLTTRDRLESIKKSLPRLAPAKALNGSVAHGHEQRPLPAVLGADPVCAESIRNVCASILLSQSEHPPRVLMVTSAVPAEGKSTIACELARALAERGAPTLLVECDLRRPTFGRLFDVGPKDGLSMYLAGFTGDLPAIHEVGDNLSVVVAGPPAPNPAALLNSDKLKALLSRSMKTHQFVILDAPPVIGLADSRVLAPSADGVVVVVRAGQVARTMLRRVCAMLESTGANIIGTILNGSEGDETAATYGYYGYHGYHGYHSRTHQARSSEQRAD